MFDINNLFEKKTMFDSIKYNIKKCMKVLKIYFYNNVNNNKTISM